MNKELSCFKAYDVRGELGVNFNSDICYVIGCAFAEIIDPKVVILGRDVRESSPELSNSLSKGLMDQGVNVYDCLLYTSPSTRDRTRSRMTYYA